MSKIAEMLGLSNDMDTHEAAPIPTRYMKNERVAIITDDKVEDIEFFYPYYRLTEAGYTVDVITEDGGPFEGKHGIGLKHSKAIDSVYASDYVLLYLPGGKAPLSLRQNEDVIEFVRDFAMTGRPIAAICHGPQILITADLVRGRTMAAWPEVAKELEAAGGHFSNEALQEDGQFITARMPGDLHRHLAGTLECLARFKQTQGMMADPMMGDAMANHARTSGSHGTIM